MSKLSKVELVATLRLRIDQVVRYRMDPKLGNNTSVLVGNPVRITLTRREREGYEPDELQRILDREVVGYAREASGYTFTVTEVTPGDVLSEGAVRATFSCVITPPAR